MLMTCSVIANGSTWTVSVCRRFPRARLNGTVPTAALGTTKAQTVSSEGDVDEH